MILFFFSQLAKIQLYSLLIWHLGSWIFCRFLGLHLSPYWNLSSQILIAELPVTCLSKTQWKDYKSPATPSTFSCRNIWVLFILCKNWRWNLLNLAAGNVYFDLTVLQDGPRKPMRLFLHKVKAQHWHSGPICLTAGPLVPMLTQANRNSQVARRSHFLISKFSVACECVQLAESN